MKHRLGPGERKLAYCPSSRSVGGGLLPLPSAVPAEGYSPACGKHKGGVPPSVVTEAGEERLIPQWMFDPNAFQPSPVELPLIGLEALRHLLRVFSSSPLRPLRSGQEGKYDDAITAVSAASEPQRAASRQGTQRSEEPLASLLIAVARAKKPQPRGRDGHE